MVPEPEVSTAATMLADEARRATRAARRVKDAIEYAIGRDVIVRMYSE